MTIEFIGNKRNMWQIKQASWMKPDTQNGVSSVGPWMKCSPTHAHSNATLSELHLSSSTPQLLNSSTVRPLTQFTPLTLFRVFHMSRDAFFPVTRLFFIISTRSKIDNNILFKYTNAASLPSCDKVFFIYYYYFMENMFACVE